MTMYHRQAWPIARLLFTTHLPLLFILWVIFAIVIVAIIIGLAAFTTVEQSVWNGATQFARWFALGYGVYLVRQLLPVYVAQGQTRRDFMIQAGLFTLVAVVVLSGLMILGFVLETVVHRVMGEPQALAAAQAYLRPGQIPQTFVVQLAMFLVWIVGGALIGAGFYHSDEWGLVTFLFALVLISTAGLTIGFNGLPFVGMLLDRIQLPLAITAPLCAGTFLVGLAMIWSTIRDIPIRNKTA